MDLYYRVAVTSIRIPALRDRQGDVERLVQHFLAHFAERHRKPLPVIDHAVLERLAAYTWPGNVRELRNVVESMLLVCEGPRLSLDCLPAELEADTPTTPDTHPASVTPLHAVQRISEVEAELIRRTIAATGGNLTLTASKLAIAKSTLYQKLRDYDLHDEVSAQRSLKLSGQR